MSHLKGNAATGRTEITNMSTTRYVTENPSEPARLTYYEILAKLPERHRTAIECVIREEVLALLEGRPKPRGAKAKAAQVSAIAIDAEKWFTEDVNLFLRDERPFGPETILSHRARVPAAWAVAQLLKKGGR